MNWAKVSGLDVATMGGGYSKNIKERGRGSFGTVYEFHGGVIQSFLEKMQHLEDRKSRDRMTQKGRLTVQEPKFVCLLEL